MTTTQPPPAHQALLSEVILTHLAGATVQLEDMATERSPGDAMVRIGDDVVGVRLVDDVATLRRLLADAHRQLTRLDRARSRSASSEESAGHRPGLRPPSL